MEAFITLLSKPGGQWVYPKSLNCIHISISCVFSPSSLLLKTRENSTEAENRNIYLEKSRLPLWAAVWSKVFVIMVPLLWWLLLDCSLAFHYAACFSLQSACIWNSGYNLYCHRSRQSDCCTHCMYTRHASFLHEQLLECFLVNESSTIKIFGIYK